MTSQTTLPAGREALLDAFLQVRSTTEILVASLEREDMVVQSMPDVSPTKWHLAHVTWFFETLVLGRSGAPYAPFDERYPALFNSYYKSLGDPFPRARRGDLSRPTVPQVLAYRRHVDDALARLIERGSDVQLERISSALRVGLNHEQQHQELLLMDIKHVLAQNPLHPVYREVERGPASTSTAITWQSFPGGRMEVGAASAGFSFDNERPRHRVWLEPFELASRPVTVGEYRAFMADGGYARPELWLSDGWDMAQREGWSAPEYWVADGGGWNVLTLGGRRELDPGEPVCHVSYYEADAYATWAQCRLPSEQEWECAATEMTRGSDEITGNLLEQEKFHPAPLADTHREQPLGQLYGDVWEWTSSPYAPYPGYRPFEGALGEYNGKFMINQMVLRGGCCVTPRKHLRATYRNFYYPHQRWVFSGIRLAR